MRSIPVFKYAAWLSIIILIFSVLIWTGFIKIPASPLEINSATNKTEFSISDFATYVSSIFSTLSLIWLVVNAWQQREDLALQREEMKRNNEHQADQAKQLKEAADISLKNLNMQKEIYFRELINLKMKSLSDVITASSSRYKIIYETQYNYDDDDNENPQFTYYNVIEFKLPKEIRNDSHLENLLYVCYNLKDMRKKYNYVINDGPIGPTSVTERDTISLAYILELSKDIKQTMAKIINSANSEIQFPEFLFFPDLIDQLNFFFELYGKVLNQTKA